MDLINFLTTAEILKINSYNASYFNLQCENFKVTANPTLIKSAKIVLNTADFKAFKLSLIKI